MAWSNPRTWVAGERPTAAQFNQEIRDNLNAVVPVGPDAWPTFTPTLTQSGTVTKTVNYARYTRVGRMITAQVALTVVGTGTAANDVVIGLPVAAAATAIEVGGGLVYNSSATNLYKGMAEIVTSTTVKLQDLHSTSLGFLGSSGFVAALDTADLVRYFVTYEAAS